MNILFFSDWRKQPLTLIENIIRHYRPDVILYGGDDIERFIDEKKGNHFSKYAEHSTYGLGGILGNDGLPSDSDIFNEENLYNLHKQGIKIGDIGIIGIEGALSRIEDGRIVNNIGQITQDDSMVIPHIKKLAKSLKVKEENLIIVSHTPPFGCLDMAIRFGVESIGSKTLLQYIEDKQPLAILCGHVHSQGGKVKKLGKTTVVNASSDDQKINDYNVAYIEIEKDITVSWLSMWDFVITKIPNIGEKSSDRLLELGIETPQQFFDLHDEVIKGLDMKINDSRLKQIRAYEQAVKEDQIVRFSNERFDFPSSIIFYSVETDLAQNPWMIGAIGPDGDIFQEYELDKKPLKRKKMLSDFISFIEKYPNSTLVSWSGSNFAFHAIKNELNIFLTEKIKLWSTRTQFDPLKILKKQFVLKPKLTFSLEDISGILGYQEYELENKTNLSGLQVGQLYEQYKLGNKKPLKETLKGIIIYNLLDIKALKYVCEQLGHLDKDEMLDFYIAFDSKYHREEQITFPNKYIEEAVKGKLKEN